MYNLIAVAGEAQEILPVLPVGEELGDEELAAVEGEAVAALYVALRLAIAGVKAAYAVLKRAPAWLRWASQTAYDAAVRAKDKVQSAYDTAVRAADAVARFANTPIGGPTVGGTSGAVIEAWGQIDDGRFHVRGFARSIAGGAFFGWWWWSRRPR